MRVSYNSLIISEVDSPATANIYLLKFSLALISKQHAASFEQVDK